MVVQHYSDENNDAVIAAFIIMVLFPRDSNRSCCRSCAGELRTFNVVLLPLESNAHNGTTFHE